MRGSGGPGASSAAAPEEQQQRSAQAGAAPPPPQPPLPADEDDDIFGDAGTDYQPTIKDRERLARKTEAAAEAEAAAAAEGQRGGYFGEGGADLHADLPPLPRDGTSAKPSVAGFVCS